MSGGLFAIKVTQQYLPASLIGILKRRAYLGSLIKYFYR